MDDRYRYVRKTPPAGVASQIATPNEITPEHTPPPVNVPEALAQIGRRQKLTQETSAGTHEQVQALRTELGSRIDQLDGRVDGMAVQSATVAGKMDVLIDVVNRSLDEQSVIRVSRVTASIDLGKTSELAEIDERRARRAFPRELVFKVIAIVGPPLAAAIALLAQSRC